MCRLILALTAISLAHTAISEPSSAARVSEFSTTICESAGLEGACRIAWNIPAASRAFFWIEEMHPDSNAWRRVSGPMSTPSGITAEPVPEGRLYRVVACEDASGAQSCIGSTVLWVPFHARSADAIPDTVNSKKGVKMVVSKSSPLGARNLQYNVYLMERLMSGLADEAMQSMPPMTAPRFGLDASRESLLAEATDDERIHHLVYKFYEARRTAKSTRE